MNPDDSYAYLKRGFMLLKFGKYEEALKDINTSIQLDPENPLAYIYRADIYVALDNKCKTCKDIEKSLELDDDLLYNDEVKELYQTYCEKNLAKQH
jgi:tetratricopeptide (TPR) repeat protein